MDAHAIGKTPGYHFKPNDYLRHYRRMRHWTQTNLADELYQLCELEECERGIINANMIGGWERGEHQPSLFWQRKLCEIFGTTPDELGFLEATSQVSSTHPAPLLLPRQSSSMPHAELEATAYSALVLYLQQQQVRILDAFAPGSAHLRVRDIVGDNGLFIAPPWESTQGTIYSPNLIEHLIDSLGKGQRTLLLGDAGQGKTTVLKQVFASMADQFLKASAQNAPLPLYIPLRELSAFRGNAFELLWTYIGEDFPLPCEEFIALARQQRIVFLFDGFDEIQGEITQQIINERAASKLFACNSVLSCRKSFFDSYLSMSPLLEYYAHKVELQPLTLSSSVMHYITAFCRQKQGYSEKAATSSPEKIIATIQMNQELQDLARRPLLLLMILEIFTNPKEMEKQKWSVTKLYRTYTEQWLKNEASKPDSVLKWNEKTALLQEVAWSTYEHSSYISTFSGSDLARIVKQAASRYPSFSEAQLLNDLCFRTLLVASEGEHYEFLHKSIQEYYVARYVFDCMRYREQHNFTLEAIEQVLQENLPFDVAVFLKEMLRAKDISFYERDLVTLNLLNVFQRNRANVPRSISIRQHASYYLTSLGTAQAMAFLEQALEEEPNKWVQRGIMVGLTLYCGRTDMLERYITIIREDREAAAINLGFHLIYYGDQTQNTDYYVQTTERCDKTVAAIFRHLQDEGYKNGWTLDLFTLCSLLEQRDVSILDTDHSWLPILKEFISQEHRDQCDMFHEEKERLKQILEGVITWN